MAFLQCAREMPLNLMPVLMSLSIAVPLLAVLALSSLTENLPVEWAMQYRVAAQSSKGLRPSLLVIK